MANIHLDDYDKKILKYLQEDSSISNIELSKKIGLAPSSCLLRVKNLKEEKVLTQYTAMVDEKLLGFEITCFAKIQMTPLNKDTSKHFIEEAKKIPEIVECYTITGDSAFLLKIVAKSVQYYRDFIFDKLLSVPNVSNIETSIVVGTEKKTSVIPLD
ncbi:MAG: Lrp/AsnC family transcriptional regulator [Acholeplasmatales bacterium]|jgi:Lrp/AsnC family transcriptional regulator|nr:Lrp/AsnC family transcriptional regulator [Acholeplasmatales bacterium]